MVLSLPPATPRRSTQVDGVELRRKLNARGSSESEYDDELDELADDVETPGAEHLQTNIEGLIPFLIETPAGSKTRSHKHKMNPELSDATLGKAIDESNEPNRFIRLGPEFYDIQRWSCREICETQLPPNYEDEQEDLLVTDRRLTVSTNDSKRGRVSSRERNRPHRSSTAGTF